MDVLPEKAATALEDRADSEEHKRRNKAFLSHWPKRRAGCPPATQGVGRRASPKGPDSTGRAFSSRREGGMGGLCAAAGCPVIQRD